MPQEEWNLIITRLDQVAKIAGEREYQLSQGKEEAHKLRRAYDELCDQLEASRVESCQEIESLKQELAETKEKLQDFRQAQSPALSESRCGDNLKILGSNELEFKNWNDELVYATSQLFGTT